MILSDPLRNLSMENFFGQNPNLKTKSFTELVTEHLMKFQKKIDSYFLSLDEDELAYIRNPFTSNAQMLQAGTNTHKEELVELLHDGFARAVYYEKNLCEVLVYDVQLVQKHQNIILVVRPCSNEGTSAQTFVLPRTV